MVKKSLARIGIISDTHGLLRPQVAEPLQGCDLILHAGDIGKPEVLQRLAAIAPVKAVRGNVDKGVWADGLPWIDHVRFENLHLILIHDIHTLTTEHMTGDISLIISGHSHRSKISESQGVLYINPGSAGPRRFRLPVSLGLLEVGDKGIMPSLIELEV